MMKKEMIAINELAQHFRLLVRGQKWCHIKIEITNIIIMMINISNDKF